MAARTDLRDQFIDLLDGVTFPVSSRRELESQLTGVTPYQRFEAGDVSLTLSRLDTVVRGSDRVEYPYESADALVEDVLAALEDEGHL